MHILIVEDIRFSSIVVENYLKLKHYQFLTVSNGLEALEALNNGPEMDVVICDLHLPDFDGIQLFHEVQKLKRYKRNMLPFVLLTASTNLADHKKAESAGFTAVLTKPLDTQALGEILMAIDDGQGYLKKDPEKSKILVLDANGRNHELLQEVFVNTGYRLMLMNTVKDGLEALLQYSGIKAIITDLELPDMDANAMMGELNTQIRYKAIEHPIAILLADSTSSNVDLMQMAYLSGFNEIITHPIDRFNLKQKINKVFMNSGQGGCASAEIILIVDDIHFHCVLAKNLLIKNGLDPHRYQIETCTSGEAALEFLKSNPKTRIVLTDMMLRDMTGLDLYQQYEDILSKNKALGLSEKPSFVLMTVKDDPNLFDEALTLGFKTTFAKPLDADMFKEFILSELVGEKVTIHD